MSTFELQGILTNALAGIPCKLDWDEGEENPMHRFGDVPPLKYVGPTPEELEARINDPRQSCVAWDTEAEKHHVVIGEPGYCVLGAVALGFGRPPGPSRIPSSRCASGKRPYCTCDTCF